MKLTSDNTPNEEGANKIGEEQMVHFDARTKRQVLMLVLFIDGFYMLGVISGILNSFNNLIAGISLVMILGIVNLYYAYLLYTGDF